MNRNDYIFKGNEALDGVKLLHKTSTIGKNNITITICQISSCPNFDKHMAPISGDIT